MLMIVTALLHLWEWWKRRKQAGLAPKPELEVIVPGKKTDRKVA